jgi:hypothetical protein
MELKESSADVYTQLGHAVAVLIKAALDVAMELDHIKNRANLDANALDDAASKVERCHAAIDTLQANDSIVNARFILNALITAESFMSGFEDDDAQVGINGQLLMLRIAIGKVLV